MKDEGSERAALFFRLLLVAMALYLFLVGIGTMSTAFKAMGKGFAEDILSSQASPLVSLFIGILATTLVQSSSTTTSVVVGMVAAGIIELDSAIYMVMGANVGTTVTNTIVSLGHITRSAEYKRAFAAATVHDFFNVIVLLILFPLEVYTGFLDKLAVGCSQLFQDVGGTKLANPIKALTKPTINELKGFVEWIAPNAVGGLLLALAVLMTFAGLIGIVKLLRSIMVARVENLFDRVLFKSAFRSLVFGMVLTVFMQSSSITTSVAIPLVGAGVLSIRQVFPYTMGANIGTTMTALLASLAALAGADADGRATALLGLTLAFHHVLFNVVGVALVFPIRNVPIRVAEGFASLAMWNRLIPLVYIVVAFYLLPFTVVWFGRPT